MEFYKAYINGIETIEGYDIYAKSLPFDIAGEAKELPNNDWYDEDGDDEYIPQGGLKMKAYEIETEWAYKGNKFSANTQIRKFVDMLRTAGLFSLKDEYTNLVRENVRFVKLHDDAELVRKEEGDIVIFKVTLKVNNPETSEFIKYEQLGDKAE